MIHLKLKEDEEEKDKEFIEFIKNGVGDFDLPKFLYIPKGERAMTFRAKILLQAGIEALKKEYPQKKDFVGVSVAVQKKEKEKEEEIMPKGWF